MILFPNAKINLGLTVVSKRTDGYHSIETCFVPFGWKDALEIIENLSFEFSSSGIPIAGKVENNLCIKAYELVQKKYNLPNIKMYLHKNIPMGAGLGGGSADAAFTLLLLNQKFNLKLSNLELQNYARILGSDCAFFIENKPMFATEKGDVFKNININIEGLHLLVVYPNLLVSTSLAYSGVVPNNATANLYEALQKPIDTWKNTVFNDFEISVFKKHPQLKEIKENLYKNGAIYAAMSGSGSAVYGLFDKIPTISFDKKFEVWIGSL